MHFRESPDYVQISLAASIALGFQHGSFYRNATLTGLNILLCYREGCQAACRFCGLSRTRRPDPDGKTFIRVRWPAYPLKDVIERTKLAHGIQRICVSMITHPRAVEDCIGVIRRIRKETDIGISALVSPTLIPDDLPIVALKDAGADRIGIAIDAATSSLFERLRGIPAGGPHEWEHYWEVVRISCAVFGSKSVGIHLIVGLGETEREMVETIQKAQNMGVATHLFSFFPEKGSPMERHKRPPLRQYRNIQLARWIINEGLGSIEQMTFDRNGTLLDFGTDIEPLIRSGKPFMTSGCPGRDIRVACNRPFGNERPSDPIRNYPFPPEPEDIYQIMEQIGFTRGRNNDR